MTSSNRFAVFVVDPFAPSGGWGDLLNVFGTIEEAKQNSINYPYDNYQIVDLEKLEIVYEGMGDRGILKTA